MAAYREAFYRSADGLDLYYRDYASETSRTPVLCLPGLTRNSRDFDFIAAHIAESRRVLTTDLRGRGRSAYDPNWMRYAVPMEVADVSRLLEAAGLSRVIVLGTSRGGIVGMALSALPGVVAALILNDIGAELEAEGLSRIVEMVGRDVSYASWEDGAAALKSTYGAMFPTVTDERWIGFAKALFREDSGRIVPDYDLKLGEAMRMGRKMRKGGANLWPLFRELRGRPTLVLRGANSDLLSAATLAKMQDEDPDLVAVTVPDRGHAPFLDEPEAVTAIDEFLAGLP